MSSKNITQKPHKTIYLYKEHKILVHIRLKNYGIYEITWRHGVHNLHNYANFQKTKRKEKNSIYIHDFLQQLIFHKLEFKRKKAEKCLSHKDCKSVFK